MPDDDAPTIDNEALDALEAMLGAEKMAGFIGEYIEQADRLHAELRRAWDAHDWEGAYRPAHNLVSNAGNFGARRVAMLADAAQRAARQQDAPALDAALAPLQAAIIEAAAALRRLYPAA